jgi:hypothetical protein
MQRVRQKKLRNPLTRYFFHCEREDRKWNSFFRSFDDNDKDVLERYVCDEQDGTKLKNK